MGFEPTVYWEIYKDLADLHLKPLSHLSWNLKENTKPIGSLRPNVYLMPQYNKCKHNQYSTQTWSQSSTKTQQDLAGPKH